MFRKQPGRAFGLMVMSCVVLVGGGIASATITIDTVTVGNPGNATDPASGSLYGSVSYVYNIGKYEVTAGQYAAFLNAVAATDSFGLYNAAMAENTAFGPGITQLNSPGSHTYNVDPSFTNRPMTSVSFGNAMRFANWLHNGQPTGAQNLGSTEDGAYFLNGASTNTALQAATREADWQWAVTSEDEWYKAAYYNPGGSYFLYAAGSSSVPGRDLSDGSGNNANYFTGVGPYPIASPLYTTVAGEFQNSDSPYGTFDQGGNVFEWTEGKLTSTARLLRGGAFNSTNFDLLATTRAYGDLPFNSQISLGFRVVQVPEPAALGMLGLGGVGILLRRRSGGKR